MRERVSVTRALGQVAAAALVAFLCTTAALAAMPTNWKLASKSVTPIGGADDDLGGDAADTLHFTSGALKVSVVSSPGSTVTANQGTAGSAGWPVKAGAREGATARYMALTDQDQVAVVMTSTSANQGTAAAATAPWSTRLSDGTSFYDGTKTGQLPAALTAGGSLKAAVVEALPAGTAVIGQTSIDQTTPGTTNRVAIVQGQTGGVTGGAGAVDVTTQRVAIATDANVVNATQGTAAAATAPWHVRLSNGTAAYDAPVAAQLPAALSAGGSLKVVNNEALPAGTNNIGDVDVLSIAAGANVIGKVSTDQTTPGTTDHVSPISGQNGVAGGAGVNGATVQRVTIATDDETNDDLDTLAGTVTAARLAINPIAGQAGVAAGSGINGVTVQRVTIATDDEVNDNLGTLAARTDLTRAAGAVDANTVRVEPTTGAAVALNSVTRGAGAVDATTIRVEPTTGAAVALNSVTRNAGVVDATTIRAALATDANAVQQGAGSGVATTPWSSRISDGTSFFTLGLPLAPEVGITRIASTASNGTTAVQLVAATASQIVYPTTITIANTSATDYTVDLLSSTGPTIIKRVFSPQKTTFTIDFRGDVRTDANDALQFKLDAAGATVYVSGAAIKR